eukprot:TRINITY_DN8495_c0_g1_i1.p1 TRINITY_DN8495_c0_g1~~TRINITY_DN8495_c0_g1_i1.p1  ORF type:complete len:114 (+),score=37.11 TRINITY_DN8495_c0_g1_i1:569-910(+)
MVKENMQMKMEIKELKKNLVKSKSSEQVSAGLRISNEVIKKLIEQIEGVKGKQLNKLAKTFNSQQHKKRAEYRQMEVKDKLDGIKVRIERMVTDSIRKDQKIKLLMNKLRSNN